MLAKLLQLGVMRRGSRSLTLRITKPHPTCHFGRSGARLLTLSEAVPGWSFRATCRQAKNSAVFGDTRTVNEGDIE
jgi:hypothetical protein